MKNPTRIKVFHGSGRNFDSFNQSFGRVINDFMGGGIGYFTSSEEIAKKYAKNGARFARTNTPIVYLVELNLKNVFDVDEKFKGTELKQILPPESKHEEFARGAGLLRVGVDKYSVLASLKTGGMELSGAQIFQGLSSGGSKSDNARNHLIKKGFDGLRYNGGQNMSGEIKHDVYIPYKSETIKILKKTLI